MIYTSKAIVLKKTKYSDHSYITHLFTKEEGHQTFIISAKKSRSKHVSPALFPLTIVEIEAYLNPKRNIQKLKSISINYPAQTIPFNPVKSSIALFLSEIYFECTKNEVKNEALFNFLSTSIQILDIIDKNIRIFHLKNMIDLSKQMGFMPSGKASSETPFFDLNSGLFCKSFSKTTTNTNIAKIISQLLQIPQTEMNTTKINISNISECLFDLIRYYELHQPGFNKPKSTDIFKMLI